ncbi:GAF domain-containing protein [Halomonas sp. ZH2S]|uniref:GAF domain-containing protein n=1 Tax=Vreelandella zhuhanensis TaxID=2684210 RepID=A0A7X3GYS9_9GAMM|nr:GAF domain-containing protein [Halomonas zhuhanensis]MWJ27214.1 GAF domain-containing protein [Halomonas zhuhanensis]
MPDFSWGKPSPVISYLPNHTEERRLAALHATGLLDTLPEERFDRLTRLAYRLFEVPIALVSMVDRDRQWFKSCQGVSLRETPRNIAFCSWAIQNDELMEVPDTRLDERFRDNPFVTGPPYVRFYAGQPLHLATGERIGTLCLIEPEPRQLLAREKQLLSDIALLVEQEFSLGTQYPTDNITGCLEELAFTPRATNTLALCRRYDINAVLIRIRILNMARIGQLHGDEDGGEVGSNESHQLLEQLGKTMVKIASQAEVVGRYGNDTVAALLMDATLGEIRLLCAQLKAALQRWNGLRRPGETKLYCHIEVTSASLDDEETLAHLFEGEWTHYFTIDER